MVIRPDLDEFMVEVRKHLPPGFDFEVTARMRGAFMRAREVKSAIALFRLALAFGGCGMSLRETCAWAAANGLADLADTSLLERLCKAAPWLGDIVAGLIARQAQVPVGRWAGYRLRALDGTSICQPGADRTTWRLHVGYDLATGQADQIILTDGCGAENLQRLVYRPGDIVLADRCYARPRDLRPVIAAGAHFIVRMGWNALRLSKPDGTPFDLFAALAVQTAQEGEVPVRLDDGAAAEPLLLRLVIRRKSDEEAEAEKKAPDQGRQEARQDARSAQSSSRALHPAADGPAGQHLPSRRRARALSLPLATRIGLQAHEKPGRARSTGGQETGTRAGLDLRQADRLPDRRTKCRAGPGLSPLWTRQRPPWTHQNPPPAHQNPPQVRHAGA